MKYLYLFIISIALGCSTPKEKKSNSKSNADLENKLNQLKRTDSWVLDSKQDLIVLLQNTSKVIETDGSLNDNGLIWDKKWLEKGSMEDGFIRIPADQKSKWLSNLIESGKLKNVRLYSEKFYKELAKLTKNDSGILDSKQGIAVLLQDPSQITETIKAINDKGLVWDKDLIDVKTLKDGIIRVPAEKKDLWLNQLIESGELKNIKIYSEEALEELIKKEKNAFLIMRKTACFGDCPIYDVLINKEGIVTFNGKKHTLLKGKDEFQLSEKEFNALKEKLGKKEFTSYKSKYDNPKIKDLPSTYITHNGKKVEVRLWGEAPKELIDVHEFLEKILLNKKFIK